MRVWDSVTLLAGIHSVTLSRVPTSNNLPFFAVWWCEGMGWENVQKWTKQHSTNQPPIFPMLISCILCSIYSRSSSGAIGWSVGWSSDSSRLPLRSKRVIIDHTNLLLIMDGICSISVNECRLNGVRLWDSVLYSHPFSSSSWFLLMGYKKKQTDGRKKKKIKL